MPCLFKGWKALKSSLVTKFVQTCSLISIHNGMYTVRRFTFARIDISYARFFFSESAEKVPSYARLNCAVFIYFYMSLGQVRPKNALWLAEQTHTRQICSF